MMNQSDQRLIRLEELIKQLQAQLQAAQSQIATLQTNAQAPIGAIGGGSSDALFVVMAPSSGTYNGTWSGSAPTGGSSFTGTVYRVSGTGTITGLGTQTVVNWMPAPLANSKACYCIPDGAGNFAVISQSCA